MKKISDLAVGSRITLVIYSNGRSMRMEAVIKKHVKANIAVISIEYAIKAHLVFDNVRVSAEYKDTGGVPLIWSDVKIVNHNSEYVLVTKSDAVRNNRRSSYRVGISKPVLIQSSKEHGQVMMRDLSESGFSISDKSKAMRLELGDEVRVALSDLGYDLYLLGKLVRIEKKENVTIYGFKICNLCKDLSTYVALKQRRAREEKRKK